MNRPIAEEKLQAATTPAPVLGERPIAVVKRGRKKGGTKSENVPIAPATKSKLNLKSLNSILDAMSVHSKINISRNLPLNESR
jgi:hypothetical protein